MDDARRGVGASHALAWAAGVLSVLSVSSVVSGCNGLLGNSEHATTGDASTSTVSDDGGGSTASGERDGSGPGRGNDGGSAGASDGGPGGIGSLDAQGGGKSDASCGGGGAVCAPNATLPCNGYGTQTCLQGCGWSACSCPLNPVCVPGSGQCAGAQLQTCDACGQWGAPATCAGGCANGACASTEPPSCASPGPGKSDCGGGSESCCASLPVPTQTYARSYDGIEFTDSSHPATISAFRLDRYEATVGRFREFVAATVAGWAPASGSGKHTHLNGGQGLVDTGGGYEKGWDPTWPALPTTASAWTTELSGTGATWTASAGSNESLPIGGATWYEAYAFCIWDGGFLPSEAEWNDAAAGGSEQRLYPWSASFPPGSNAITCADAWYADCVAASPPPLPIAVGSDSPAGDARWGQADMAGNLFEWTLDWNVAYAGPCTDCADLSPATNTGKVIRGGAVAVNGLATEATAGRSAAAAMQNQRDAGMRCARAP